MYLCIKTDQGQASFPRKYTAIEYILSGKNLNAWMHRGLLWSAHDNRIYEKIMTAGTFSLSE